MDIAALGLHTRKPASPVPAPEAQVTADLAFPGLQQVELQHIRPVGNFGLPDARSDYGARIHYGLEGPPSDKFKFRLSGPPKDASDLPYSIFSRRKKERFTFEGESGNRVYFRLQYENAKGRKEGQGPYGPVLTAVIP
jgi:hypothetical protein